MDAGKTSQGSKRVILSCLCQMKFYRSFEGEDHHYVMVKIGLDVHDEMFY